MPDTSPSATGQTVLAVGAHPDDIEFMMAGTMLLLGDLGAALHVWHLANGSCGSVTTGPEETAATRAEEARQAAETVGATWHAPLVNDLEIFYEDALLRRVAAVVREIRPTIVLTHAPSDYMEDHQNTCRLVVTSAFARGMPNYRTDPPRDPVPGDCVLYHAMPHGLCDPLRFPCPPDLWVDIGAALPRKRAMLRAHRSQKEWLDQTQGMDSYLDTMVEFARESGRRSGQFTYAEGWRRRLHYGFCEGGACPLTALLSTVRHRPA